MKKDWNIYSWQDQGSNGIEWGCCVTTEDPWVALTLPRSVILCLRATVNQVFRRTVEEVLLVLRRQ